jgi:antitoxin HicB
VIEKNLDYYMNLPYTIMIEQEEDNDGSICYVASILELPLCIGAGKTTEEAVKELELHKRLKLKSHLEEGFPIPEPQTEYSGNINIRVDPELHARLAHEAAAYDMSLNKYTSLILERRQSPVTIKKPAMVKERKRRYTTKKPTK